MQLVWTEIWRWLRWIQKKEMEEMTKRSWKIMYFHFAWSCENFAQSCEMDQKAFLLQIKREISKLISHDLVKISHSHTKCSRKAKIGANAFLTSHNYAKLLDLMRNCWISCKMTILLLNSKFLGEEASRRPLRWCQVSTWPWPINRNFIFSFEETFRHF